MQSDNSIDHLKKARRSLQNKIGEKTVHRDDALSIAHTRLYGPTDEEKRYQTVEAMFHRLDLDHNGTLDKSELMTATENDEELSSYVTPSRALTLRKQIFEPMDLESFQNFCSPTGKRETEWTKAGKKSDIEEQGKASDVPPRTSGSRKRSLSISRKMSRLGAGTLSVAKQGASLTKQLTNQGASLTKNLTQNLSSRLVDTTKVLLGDLTAKSLKALVPALLQDVQDGNLDGVRHLVALCQDMRNSLTLNDVRDLEGRTVLHKACLGGHLSVIKVLIKSLQQTETEDQKGVSLINEADHYGNTPLMILCKAGKMSEHVLSFNGELTDSLQHIQESKMMLSATNILIENGARVDIQKRNTKDTPIHWAAFHGRPAIIDMLASGQIGYHPDDTASPSVSMMSDVAGVSRAESFHYKKNENMHVSQGLWCLLKCNRKHQFPVDVAGVRFMKAQLALGADTAPGAGLGADTAHERASKETQLFRETVLTCLRLGAAALVTFTNANDSRSSSASNNSTKTAGAATSATTDAGELRIKKSVIAEYYAHWLFWACVVGNHNEVELSLRAARDTSVIAMRIQCMEFQTALAGTCRFPDPLIVATLLRKNISNAATSAAHTSADADAEGGHFHGSILTALDAQRNSCLHLAAIASNNATHTIKCREIVRLLTTAALTAQPAIDLGLNVRNHSALLPIDYAKDPDIQILVQTYAQKLKMRRRGIAHFVQKVTPKVVNRNSFVGSSSSSSSRRRESVQNAADEESSDHLHLKYIWVLAFAKSIDLPGVQHQYDKVARWIRDADPNGMIVDILPSPRSTSPEDAEVFIGIAVRNEEALNNLAEKIGYEARLLVGAIPGQKERFYVEDMNYYEPFRTREREDILLSVMMSVFALQTYLDSGVITRMFPLHDREEATLVRDRWFAGSQQHRLLNTEAHACSCCQRFCQRCCRYSANKRGCCRTVLCCLCGADLHDVPKWQPFGSLMSYLTESSELDYDAINVLRMYNGEQIAMFYAWLCHMTCWMMIISPIGVALQVFHGWKGVSKSSYVLPMSLIIVIWGTLQHKFWKRKQAELAYIWNTREVTLDEQTRPDFRGDEGVEPVTGKIEKQDDPSVRTIKQLLSVPFLLLMMVVAVGSFIALRLLFEVLSQATGGDPTVYRTLASLSIGVSITVVDVLYEKIAIAATKWENYRTKSEYEKSLVLKTFVFRFINNNAAILWAAYYRIASGAAEKGDVDVMIDLASTVSIVMVSKQATVIALYIIYPLLCFSVEQRAHKKKMLEMYEEAELTIEEEQRSKDKLRSYWKKQNIGQEYDWTVESASPAMHEAAILIQRKFRQDQQKRGLSLTWHSSLVRFHRRYPKIPLTELWAARIEIIENAMMAPWDGLVNGYADTMIQYSYVMLYSTVFPMASFLACCVNVLYIRFSVDINLRVVQRGKPQAAKNIGSWEDIVSVLTFVAIVSNIGILHFTFGGTFSSMDLNNMTLANTTGASGNGLEQIYAFTEWYDIEFDTASKSLWALIILEHISIMAKIFLEHCMSNEPHWVREAIRNRRKLAKLQVMKEETAIDDMLVDRASLSDPAIMTELVTRHALVDKSITTQLGAKQRAAGRVKALTKLSRSIRKHKQELVEMKIAEEMENTENEMKTE